MQKSCYGYALLASSFLISTSALAQSVPEAGPSEQGGVLAQGGAGAQALGEIVVTAQRRSEKLHDVPLTITAKSGEELERTGITGTKGLTIAVPGLSFTTQGAWAEPNIRGIHTTLTGAGYDSPIAMYLDGLYLSNQIANVFDLPDVERVEVLKGPQGTLFGRNATGGAISIHTRDPSFHLTGNVSGTMGFYTGSGVNDSMEQGIKGFVSGPLIDDLLAVSFAGYYNHIDGYLTDARTNQGYGKVSNQLYRGKLLFTPDPNIRILLAGSYSERHDELASSGPLLGGYGLAQQLTPAGDPRFPGAIVPFAPWHVAGEMNGGSHVDGKSWNVMLRGEFTIPGAGTITSLTGYVHNRPLVAVDNDASYSPSCRAANVCFSPYFVAEYNQSFQQEVTFASERFGDFDFVAGLFYYHDKAPRQLGANPPIDGGDILDLDAGTVVDRKEIGVTNAYAGFGEVNWYATDKLKIIGGLRYSYETRRLGFLNVLADPNGDPTFYPLDKPKSFDSLTPRISIRYDITPNANVYATYSQGFKSGVINVNRLTQPKNYIDPEKIKAYEVGTKIGTPDFNLNASAFYYDYTDLQIQFVPIGNLIDQLNANAEIYGFELDSTVRLGKLQLRAAGSWVPHAEFTKYDNAPYFVFDPVTLSPIQSAIDAKGMRLLKTPKFTGSATATYTTPVSATHQLQLNGTVYYSSSLKFDVVGSDYARAKSYTVVNLQASLEPSASEGVRLALWVKNLTNKAYVQGATPAGGSFAGMYGAPREIGATVGFAF